MMKKIRLTESDLNNIIKESVKRTLMEMDDNGDESYREKTFLDDLYNIQSIIKNAIQEAENGTNGDSLNRIYGYCQEFIDDYYKVFIRGDYKLPGYDEIMDSLNNLKIR